VGPQLGRRVGAVRRGESRLGPAVLTEPDGTGEPGRQRLRQLGFRRPESDPEAECGEAEGDQQDQSEPLDRPLPALGIPLYWVAGTRGECCAETRAEGSNGVKPPCRVRAETGARVAA
jgi:hypothetical protein